MSKRHEATIRNLCQHHITGAGFTLIELLITISIIALLFAVILVALNPLRIFADSRNATRWVAVSQLLDATQVYIVQNRGGIPNEVEWSENVYYQLGTADSGCAMSCGAMTTAPACLDMTDLLYDKVIKDIPFDTRGGTPAKTGFYIFRENNSIVTVGSCYAELGETIAATR